MKNLFFPGLGLWMVIIVLLGFWPTYFGRVTEGDFSSQAIIHFHALIFVGWIGLFIWQASLIRRRKVALHKKWGKFGFYYGILLLITGVITGLLRNRYYLDEGMEEQAAFTLLVSMRDMVGFAVLFGLALYYRKKASIHRMWILGAGTWLLVAAVARISMNYFNNNTVLFLLIWLLPIFVGFIIEWSRFKSFPRLYAAMFILILAMSVIPIILGGFI